MTWQVTRHVSLWECWKMGWWMSTHHGAARPSKNDGYRTSCFSCLTKWILGGGRCCSQHLYPVEFVHCGWQHYCAGWCNSSLLCACVRWCSCVTTACWWWVTLWKKHSSQPPTSWQLSTRRLHWPVDQCLLSCTVWYSDASVSKYVWKYIYLYVFTQPVDGTLGLEALCFQVVCSSMCACNCHLCFYAVLERGIL